MRRITALLAALAFLLYVPLAGAGDGLIKRQSPFGVTETLDRLEAAADERGLKVFARIDHAAGAESVGQSLRPTALLIFGNPQAGTPLMQCAQTAGIDLPMKALAWADADGQVWLAYNDPAYLAQRHSAGDCPVVESISKALAGLAAQATGG